MKSKRLNFWYRDILISVPVVERESLVCWALDFVLTQMELEREYAKIKRSRLVAILIGVLCFSVSLISFVFIPSLLIKLCLGLAGFLFVLQCYISIRDIKKVTKLLDKLRPHSFLCYIVLQAGVNHLIDLADSLKIKEPQASFSEIFLKK